MVRSWKEPIYLYDFIKCHMRGGVMDIYNSITELDEFFEIEDHPSSNQMKREILKVFESTKYNPTQSCDDGVINLDKYYID